MRAIEYGHTSFSEFRSCTRTEALPMSGQHGRIDLIQRVFQGSRIRSEDALLDNLGGLEPQSRVAGSDLVSSPTLSNGDMF